MSIAATVFLTLGVLVIGFGLMSLGNILNLPFTDVQKQHADITQPHHRMDMVRIMGIGAALLAIGSICAALAAA